MATKKIRIGSIKPNQNNPRFIKSDKFKKLVNSISEFPKMMELRPIVVDDEMIIQGGNMRYQALKHLGYKTIPETWIKKASDFTQEELDRFIVVDNLGFGEWDWEMIANEWDTSTLIDWGMDIPAFDLPEEPKPETKEIKIKLTISPDYSDIEHEVRAELEEMQGRYNGIDIK